KSLLVRAHLDESQPGRVKLASMLVTQPGKVVSVVRDGKPVRPTPAPDTFNLSPGAASLKTSLQTIADGPAEVPPVGPTEKAILAALLDISHWPRSGVDVGASWTRDVVSDVFTGHQTYRLVETPIVADEAVAVIEVTIDGNFAGAAAETYKFD